MIESIPYFSARSYDRKLFPVPLSPTRAYTVQGFNAWTISSIKFPLIRSIINATSLFRNRKKKEKF